MEKLKSEEYWRIKKQNSLDKIFTQAGTFFTLLIGTYSYLILTENEMLHKLNKNTKYEGIIFGILSLMSAYFTYKNFKQYQVSKEVIKNLERDLETK